MDEWVGLFFAEKDIIELKQFNKIQKLDKE